jgi:hypothetical protein
MGTRPGRAVSLALLALLGACGTDPTSTPGADAGPPPPPSDAGTGGKPIGGPVAHVPAEGAFPGTGRLILQDGDEIDTDTLTINGQAFAGDETYPIVLDSYPQAGEGSPQLAVLHVGDFGIESGTVTVRGARALVIIAEREIRLAGILQVGATAQTPGPGGFGPGAGPSAGGVGLHAGDFQDGGGGGGGHGSIGGVGGAASCAVTDCALGGAGGAVFDGFGLGVLQGGSGGGTGSIVSDEDTCVPGLGGAGGGAVQLTAMMRIRIQAGSGVLAGGGGGAAGAPDQLCGENGGGGGGGAGGTIILQSPDIQHRGVLAANGGGGGAGASESVQNPGTDALPGIEPAPGGASVNDFGHAGGCGDALDSASCVHEGTDGEGNAGGGGGGVGWIIALTVPNGYDGIDGVASPMVDVRSE